MHVWLHACVGFSGSQYSQVIAVAVWECVHHMGGLQQVLQPSAAGQSHLSWQPAAPTSPHCAEGVVPLMLCICVLVVCTRSWFSFAEIFASQQHVLAWVRTDAIGCLQASLSCAVVYVCIAHVAHGLQRAWVRRLSLPRLLLHIHLIKSCHTKHCIYKTREIFQGCMFYWSSTNPSDPDFEPETCRI